MMEMRTTFHKKLAEIQGDMLAMGGAAGEAILRSIDSLKKRDLDAARRVIADDRDIDRKRYEIEEKCIELLATQQPMAGDLRVTIALLSMTSEVERMGDYAEGIASITLAIGDQPLLKPLIDIPRMAEQTVDMLARSLDAFVKRDAEAARRIRAEDEMVDNLYDQVFRELLTFMTEDPRTITRATRLIWVAHNIERIADRVTNICEQVVFVVTGKMEAPYQPGSEAKP